MLAVAMSFSAMATQTARVTITLKGGNATYSLSSVDLIEDDARSAAAESGYDGPCFMNQSNSFSTLIYGLIGTSEYSTVATNNLDGQKIGFITNKIDHQYTLEFTNVSGRTLKLYDRVTKTETTIEGNRSYEFTVANFEYERTTINNRFEMELLSLHPITSYIPANTGVILYNPNGGVGSNYQKNFSLEIYDGTVPAYTDINDLKPASAYATNHTGHIYVLHGDMMYTYEDEASGMKPNKAFLQIDAQYPAPQRIAFRFNEEQGVENIEVEGKAVKFVENGRVFIKRGEKVYNLQGQLVK